MALEVNGLTKFYKKKAVVKDISFRVEKGDCVAVLGANGAGKTTLFEMISSALQPDSGEVIFKDSPVGKNKASFRKRAGYVTQELTLFPKLTVKEQLKFWAEMAPVNVSEGRVGELTEMAGLSLKLNERTDQLSVGMKRKLNIVLSLLHDPELIILDEPTVGIDVQSKLEIIRFLKEISGEGKILLFSSHDLQEIRELAHKTAYLYEGKLLFYGTFQEAVEMAGNEELPETADWEAFSFLFSHLK
ncbi:ABC transporter ATP-binding protein [Evansella sp. LMS18]|jgi:ABC-2 type transport system ATP-binding protein|uniref:ABC transporter ATP-binding protein n=1 Tax=Evansella sp. LMS18 TaxID=2924033 RepID=UPI0020D00EFF|nr:ABC transporter ATP-binding protein [Evansella sp. LMS18]UTR11755.1 ABC transporter ATP-binding protein [Evansella sp. LMS18]